MGLKKKTGGLNRIDEDDLDRMAGGARGGTSECARDGEGHHEPPRHSLQNIQASVEQGANARIGSTTTGE